MIKSQSLNHNQSNQPPTCKCPIKQSHQAHHEIMKIITKSFINMTASVYHTKIPTQQSRTQLPNMAASVKIQTLCPQRSRATAIYILQTGRQ